MVVKAIANQHQPHAFPLKAEPFSAKWVWGITVQKLTELKNGLLLLISKIIVFISDFFEPKVEKMPVKLLKTVTLQPQIADLFPEVVKPLQPQVTTKVVLPLKEELEIPPPVKTPEPVLQQQEVRHIELPPIPQPVEPVRSPEVYVEPLPPVKVEPTIERVGIFGIIEKYFFPVGQA